MTDSVQTAHPDIVSETPAVRIFLAGANGHMGREVISAAHGSRFRITGGFGQTLSDSAGFRLYQHADEVAEDFDVLVDFSHPDLLAEIISISRKWRKPLVIATTGYTEAQEKEIAELAGLVPVLKSANMSLGVNLLLKLAARTAAALYPDFDIDIVEAHHRLKKDSPSGTALMLAEAIRESLGLTADELPFVFDRSGRQQARPVNEIGISAVRGGNIAGEHEIFFAGSQELITLKHSALSRRVFAEGALAAAGFVLGKKPGQYSMQDMFD